MMMSDSHRRLLRTHGTFVGRALIGLLFVFSGIGILMGGTEGVAGMLASKGLPLAGLLAWGAVILKLGAGIALIVGYRVGYAAALLAVFTILTIALFHSNFMEDINFFKNLSIVGGLLYVMAYGPGDGWSLGSKGHNAPEQN